MTTSDQSTKTVSNFFEALGKGDSDAAINLFDEQAQIILVRPSENRDAEDLYGTYTGKKGAAGFLSNFSKTFSPQEFSVQNLIGNDQVAFANGNFTHKVIATGKLFSSNWALMCIVKNEKISEYRFYEDSSAFDAANS
ncbi:nuclear transport factor 2 family protein [Mucilaginibacter ginsenosidivorans]|uniref:Nuclear transport factor 2 family protein n=1 Tax=Mucilaginibacter ginsenosidivorans TaxID=398053 RepID=A0A5B8UZ21_9SPHI|nr:nuclear transport factor 2 family protein [Mucilaginibacter ginsenosidivorans]QEC64344.1 nuclear transport factor 2 family protein [Mucilaginibacter ginsenosidivorans]